MSEARTIGKERKYPMDYEAYINRVNETNPYMNHNHMKAVSVSAEKALLQTSIAPELKNAMGKVLAEGEFSFYCLG